MPFSLSRLIASPAPRSLQRDAIPFVLTDGRRIDVIRVRDPRAKCLRITVSERGARLTLPMRASLVSGDRFLLEHRDWLGEQLAGLPDDIAPPVRGQSSELPLRDERLPVSWREGR